MSTDDEGIKSFQTRPSTSDLDLLFRKPSVRVSWDERSSDRPTIFSLSPDDFLHPNVGHNQPPELKQVSSSAFLPSVMDQSRPHNTIISERVYFSDTSVSEDSIEQTLKTERREEETEEGDHLTQTVEKGEDEEELEIEESDNPVDYLDKEVFPCLLPCLEKMLFAAKENGVLKVQKSRFNGLDYLAELLWNRNPLHPERHSSHVPIFSIPFAQKHIEQNPRPIIPQSYLWTRDQAAIVIQSAIRGYLVRCQPEVQELRQFWKTLSEENNSLKNLL